MVWSGVPAAWQDEQHMNTMFSANYTHIARAYHKTEMDIITRSIAPPRRGRANAERSIRDPDESSRRFECGGRESIYRAYGYQYGAA